MPVQNLCRHGSAAERLLVEKFQHREQEDAEISQTNLCETPRSPFLCGKKKDPLEEGLILKLAVNY